MLKLLVIGVSTSAFVLIDWYFFQAIRTVTDGMSFNSRRIIAIIYWSITCLVLGAFWFYHFGNPDRFGKVFKQFLMVGVFANYFSKFIGILFLFADDIARGIRYLIHLSSDKKGQESLAGSPIPRSEFLSKVAIVSAGLPIVAMGHGILSGAHDYRIRRKTIELPNLPSSFDGIRIAQISDIHSGSFFNKIAVKGGVEMLMKENADLVFFTGDLVNNKTDEVADYIDIFNKVKAPLGVYSTLGNHDYGDYNSWKSPADKQRNLEDMHDAHRLLGWKLMTNQNQIIKQGGDKLAVLGNENWGAGRFTKYGKLDEAHKGTEEAAVKLLLSHDPSHWDAQVRKQYSDIDIMFAGHTHGFQFGVELGGFKWSPAQFIYKQWAGHYQEGEQHLYVNRGFGYLGFPGRVGMPPEITIIELKKA